jgi:hypothetical protein
VGAFAFLVSWKELSAREKSGPSCQPTEPVLHGIHAAFLGGLDPGMKRTNMVSNIGLSDRMSNEQYSWEGRGLLHVRLDERRKVAVIARYQNPVFACRPGEHVRITGLIQTCLRRVHNIHAVVAQLPQRPGIHVLIE